MNYYLNKALRLYGKINIDSSNIRTNPSFLKAIYSIELAHRNIFWRLCEYLFYLIISERLARRNILTIGRFQLKTKYLNAKSKFGRICQANCVEYLDKVIFENINVKNWSKIHQNEINDFVAFYNGDKTGAYITAMNNLMAEKSTNCLDLYYIPDQD